MNLDRIKQGCWPKNHFHIRSTFLNNMLDILKCVSIMCSAFPQSTTKQVSWEQNFGTNFRKCMVVTRAYLQEEIIRINLHVLYHFWKIPTSLWMHRLQQVIGIMFIYNKGDIDQITLQTFTIFWIPFELIISRLKCQNIQY